ncbi:MAG: hypothetical protein WBR10_13495 [Candidatus Acidiferrum sp.]
MLPAKLFAGLAIAFSILAGLAWLFISPAADIAVHDRYFVFGPALVPLFCAVTSANFTVLYYAGVRIFHAQWNRTLSFVHFSLAICSGLSGSLIYPVLTHAGNATNGEPAILGWFVPLLLGILCFAAAFVVFLMNLTVLTARIVRARFATH